MLFDLAASGHRLGYLEYFQELAGDQECRICFGRDLRHFRELVAARRVILSSADHYFPFALAVGLARRLLGKSTACTYIAAERQSFARGLVSGLRGWAMRAGKHLDAIDAVAITPLTWSPLLAKCCNDWIYDFQFCAPNRGGGEGSSPDEKALIDWAAKQETLVLLLGNLHPVRGLSDMLVASTKDPSISFLAAGKLTPAAEDMAAASGPENFRIVPGSLSMTAFDRLIALADLLWCYYPPEYDQNSGLFCNAIRKERRVVVRKGTLIHWLGTEAVGATECETQNWVPHDGVILAPEGKGKEFLEACISRNQRWIRRTLGEPEFTGETHGEQSQLQKEGKSL